MFMKTKINYKTLKNLIENNQYLQSRIKRTSKDTSSLAHIIKKKLEHRQYIQMGYCIENILKDLIVQNSDLKSIKKKNEKGVKEKDHLFVDEKNKIVFYAELKVNPNLDTEKTKSTIEKCLQISNKLKTEFKDYQVKWCLLICRYIHSNKIPSKIIRKYRDIENHVYGINEYLNMLNIQYKFTEKKWVLYINEIAEMLHKQNIKK